MSLLLMILERGGLELLNLGFLGCPYLLDLVERMVLILELRDEL